MTILFWCVLGIFVGIIALGLYLGGTKLIYAIIEAIFTSFI